MTTFLFWFGALGSAPLYFGVINRVKAVVAGRRGKPLLQGYYDLGKLFQKGAVYSRTTTRIFRIAPLVSLAALLTASFLVPYAGQVLWSFPGDLVVFVYLLGLSRFVVNLAALDTGSSFEGMGASREAFWAAFSEFILFVGLAVLARFRGEVSLSGVYAGISPLTWQVAGPLLALVTGAFLMAFLTENARIPVDDPNTHLELTMIHEALVLDYCGVDLAYIFLGVYVKFAVLGALVVNCVFPVRSGFWFLDGVIFFAGMVVLAVGVGMVESAMARLRLLKVPQFLVSAAALVILAVILGMR